MRLTAIRVANFRNILDSGTVSVQPDVTCLVGKNESGKTALLQAIYRFNPVYTSDQFVVSRDYPRWRLVRDRRSSDLEEFAPVTVTFELEAADVAYVESVLGAGVLLDTSFRRSVSYGGADSSILNVDTAASRAHLLEESAAPPGLEATLREVAEPKDFKDVLGVSPPMRERTSLLTTCEE